MAASPARSLCGSATAFVIQDVLRSVEHYRDVLWFQTEFTYGEPTFYAGVDRDGMTIHLQAAGETKRQPGQGALMAPDHPSTPPGPEPFSGAGAFLTFPVGDAAAEFGRLERAGAAFARLTPS